jgi:hypothetical protein
MEFKYYELERQNKVHTVVHLNEEIRALEKAVSVLLRFSLRMPKNAEEFGYPKLDIEKVRYIERQARFIIEGHLNYCEALMLTHPDAGE